jgi:acetyltransferase-like isoleucine patch superfamily enzyme
MGALVVPGVTVKKGARVKAGVVVVPEREGP